MILITPADENLGLSSLDPGASVSLSREEIKEALRYNVKEIANLQEALFAEGRQSLLIVLQGMDTSGKDGVVKHVLSGVNPVGLHIVSFKAPTSEELNHDFWWRHGRGLPNRGQIGVFIRSHYEETVIVRVHPEILEKQKLKSELKGPDLWDWRFHSIREIELHLVRNGFRIIKFFLHVSKDDQRVELLERIDKLSKRWKFNMQDVEERAFWDQYQNAYDETIRNTSTTYAPWYVIPSNDKWFSRLLVSNVVVSTLRSMNPQYPETTEEQEHKLTEAKRFLNLGL